METDQKLLEKLRQLEEKYSQTGQDIEGYLEGLLLSNYLPYWDYTHVDTLLTLQQPKTDFPDEKIFIVYHQITELYFNLCLHEIEQISNNGRDVRPNGEDRGWKDQLDPDFFLARLKRINAYFDALTKSFEVMVFGMEKEQFLKFRMALLPASGFQSAQYRKIELASAPIRNLLQKDHRDEFSNEIPKEEIANAFQYMYWKRGAIELSSGRKTYTLQQFELKYEDELIAFAEKYHNQHIWAKFLSLPKDQQAREDIREEMRQIDLHVNVKWPLMHYKSAARYLGREDSDVPATGGTNWQKYLPPRFQKRIFYPELFTEEEIENWGRIPQ